MQRARQAHGYTLVELLVVLALMGVLGVMVTPVVELSVQRERERELKRALWEIRDAIDAYRRLRESGALASFRGTLPLPPDLQTLTQALVDVRPDRRGEVHRLLRRIPRDPFADSSLPAERSWGLRSYLSEASAPKAGAEVFDVYSLSPAIGLNGIPLREW